MNTSSSARSVRARALIISVYQVATHADTSLRAEVRLQLTGQRENAKDEKRTESDRARSAVSDFTEGSQTEAPL